jgi:hypothetical protein
MRKKGSRPPPTAPSSESKTGLSNFTPYNTDFDKQKVGQQFLFIFHFGGQDTSPASIA